MGLVPPVVHQLVNYPDISKVDLSSVVSVVCGGAYLCPTLAAELSALLPSGTIAYEGMYLVFYLSERNTVASSHLYYRFRHVRMCEYYH